MTLTKWKWNDECEMMITKGRWRNENEMTRVKWRWQKDECKMSMTKWRWRIISENTTLPSLFRSPLLISNTYGFLFIPNIIPPPFFSIFFLILFVHSLIIFHFLFKQKRQLDHHYLMKWRWNEYEMMKWWWILAKRLCSFTGLITPRTSYR